MENISKKIFTEEDASTFSAEHLVIPEGFTEVQGSALLSFKKVTFPSSMTKLDKVAFFFCAVSLEQIIVDPDNPHYCDIDGVLFSKDKSVLICYPNEKSELEYIIPDSVKKIGKTAFAYCVNLKSVHIPDSVEKIENYAFWVCKGLKKITIPASVKCIGLRAFCELYGSTGIYVDAANQFYSDTDNVGCNKVQNPVVFY